MVARDDFRAACAAGADLPRTGQRALDEAVAAKQSAAAGWLRARLVQ